MPISYTIDSDKARVVVRFTGTVRDQELFTTFHELYGDPRHRIGMPELTDCRELQRAEFTGAGLRALARMTAAKLDPAQKAVPSMLEVFRDLAAAEQWLDQPG